VLKSEPAIMGVAMSRGIKYIIPDWDDVIDPGYNFKTETSSQQYKSNRFIFGARLWNIFNPPPVDGVLISISTIKKSRLRAIETAGDAKRFLKMPRELQLIGDCGAWQYRYMEKPPYDVKYILDIYRKLGVDYGVTLDHIPFFGNSDERIRFTIESAIKSYEIWKLCHERGDCNYTLMASIQGVDVEDYLRSLEKLYRVGFRHFAVGGLAKRDNEFILRLVNALKKVLRGFRDVEKIHMLGIARISVIPLLKDLLDYVDEVSFDNATFLRMSWVRTVGNYVMSDGRVYTSIRIIGDEHELLNLLMRYDEGSLGLEELLKTLKSYLAKIGDTHYLPYYVATLRDRPWRECGCDICRALGINVVIFRGNNRNRSRGFHNVYVFSRLLKEGLIGSMKFRFVKTVDIELDSVEDPLATDIVNVIRGAEKILVLTNCTAEKAVDIDIVKSVLARVGLQIPSFDLEKEKIYREVLKEFIKPAGEIYTGKTFRAVLKLVEKLRSCGKIVDVYFISARYGIINEKDLIIPYDATLKGMRSKEIRMWAEKRMVNHKIHNIFINRGYDLAIIILPKEYAQAIIEVLRKQLTPMILITSKLILKTIQNKNIIAMPGGSIQLRMKQIRKLNDTINRSCQNTLDNWRFGFY
jgi:hypothetical protein